MLQNDTVTTTTNFAPSNMGLYNMSYWATSDSFPTTDTTTFSTIVTDSVYGVDYDWKAEVRLKDSEVILRAYSSGYSSGYE